MAYQLTVRKVLDKVIQKEIESQQLYRYDLRSLWL